MSGEYSPFIMLLYLFEIPYVKKLLASIAIFLFMLSSMMILHPILADCGSTGQSNNYNYQSGSQNCPPTVLDVTGVVATMVNLILIIAGIVFFFMLILNGFNFITALGEQEKIDNARKGLIFSVIGFAMIFASFFILNIIWSIAGVTHGFVVNVANGKIQFNIFSSYTPTPVPSYFLPSAAPTK